jgi:hypothetical protein
MGLSFILQRKLGVKAPAAETPMKTSAPSRASSSVLLQIKEEKNKKNQNNIIA